MNFNSIMCFMGMNLELSINLHSANIPLVKSNTKIERLSLYKVIKKSLANYSNADIENGIMLYCLNGLGINALSYDKKKAREVVQILEELNLPTDLETITELFESLLEEDNKNKNGIVFTPLYIAKYMINSLFSGKSINSEKTFVIDPGCGCGIFLVAAAESILKITNAPIDAIIEQCIYGIDIMPDNARRCKLIMKLLSAKHGGNYETVQPNIVCQDSLKTDWKKLFNIKTFDFVIGNPPYLNPHDLDKETVEYLKKHFTTTQKGAFNIFYAFLEKGMQELNSSGSLSFIIPNNFLTIKSAAELREYLQTNSYLEQIIDFGENMVFKPVRTYNCIVQLNKEKNVFFDYYILPKVEDVERSVSNNITFNRMRIDVLDKNGWNLVDEKTRRNLHKIENQLISIKNLIRTGIATLRDSVYIVEKDGMGYYKKIDSTKYYIEDDLVKALYKISDLKVYDNIENAKRYIIFPYVKSESGYEIIDENTFSKNYPKTYEYLKMQRHQLDLRDKGKGVLYAWYAYGRTQGLNKYGKKLLFPTFAHSPKFIQVDDDDALFCNGYAIFEHDRYDLETLAKVFNSYIMEYYVANTSYSIEGEYYCYQKKYIERFSIPCFTEDEISFIRKASKTELDSFLWDFYGLE